MRIWLIIKLLCATIVIAVVAMTGMLVHHVHVSPLAGWPSRIIPEPGSLRAQQQVPQIARTLETQAIPEIDPGEQAYEKAYEMMVLGNMDQAREKLTALFNVFPQSAAATTARRIVGEMNLDSILSTTSMEGKQIHTVQRGDSYLAIAAHYGTTVDLMIHLNSMAELKNLQPGKRLIVMPLDFRIVVERNRKAVSLWQEGRFIREYPALAMQGVPKTAQSSSISAKIAEIGSSRVPSHAPEYSGAHKILQIASPALQIRGWDRDAGEEAPNGILLRPHDMEELALLVRTGNPVEFR